MAEKKTKSLHEKILDIMKNVEYLRKDKPVEYGTTKYKAIGEEKVTMTLRKELIAHNIVVYPIKQDVFKDGNVTTTNTEYKMVNVDNPEDFIILASSGQGADSQDKGVGKAMTYSFKYMFLRTFAIPTGEDPDNIASEQIDDENKIATIKKRIEAEDVDTEKFLYAMGHKFKTTFKSVDDMRGEQLDYAITRLDEAKKMKQEGAE